MQWIIRLYTGMYFHGYANEYNQHVEANLCPIGEIHLPMLKMNALCIDKVTKRFFGGKQNVFCSHFTYTYFCIQTSSARSFLTDTCNLFRDICHLNILSSKFGFNTQMPPLTVLLMSSTISFVAD